MDIRWDEREVGSNPTLRIFWIIGSVAQSGGGETLMSVQVFLKCVIKEIQIKLPVRDRGPSMKDSPGIPHPVFVHEQRKIYAFLSAFISPDSIASRNSSQSRSV